MYHHIVGFHDTLGYHDDMMVGYHDVVGYHYLSDRLYYEMLDNHLDDLLKPA